MTIVTDWTTEAKGAGQYADDRSGRFTSSRLGLVAVAVARYAPQVNS